MEKKCCITGHREINQEKLPEVRNRLREEILRAIGDGFEVFVSGFANGADLIFAEIVIELKSGFPGIKLEAAIPFAGRLNSKDIKALLNRCDYIKVIAEKYSKQSFILRNRYMVDASDRVIAVYDGRSKGGTASTIKYALSMEKDLVIING